MAVNFPDSPTLNQEFTVGDRTWKWDGAKWVALVQSGGASSGGAASSDIILATMFFGGK